MKGAHIQRVILAELSMSGVFHTAVNAGFIRWMQKEYPEANLCFLAEKKHTEACRNRLTDQSVIFKKWLFFPRVSKYTLLQRDFLGCLYAIWLLFRARKSDIVFITNLLPLTHWAIFLLNKLRRRPLYMALHGQLEALLPTPSLRFTKFYFRLHAPLFRHDRHTQYVVLGEPVYEAVKGLFCADTQVVVIDHPYESDRETAPPSLRFPLRFGQIGVGNRGKGTENLFRLGELLREEIEAGKLEILLVGKLDPELRTVVNPWVKWHEKPLSEDSYALEISKLHYSLFLRDSRTGRAVPSGSFFDAIKFQRPFLSLRHPFVEYYAARFPGHGTLCSSIEEMADEIRKILATC